MTEKISDELNYSPVISNHSTPVYRTVAPQNSATVSLSATSTGQITEFVIPPSVFRFDKSRLNFDLNVTATAGSFNMINANLLTTISRIVLYDTATNAQLLDISSFEKYCSMVVPAATSLTEFLTKSFYGGNLGTTIAGLPVEDMTKVITSATSSNYVSSSGTGVINGATANIFQEAGQIQKRQFYISAATNAANKLRVSLPLSAFKFTVLSSEKLYYSPSQWCLQLFWNNTDNFGFCADSAIDFTSTPGALGATTLTNISLSLCNEGNLQIVSSVIDRVMKEGISVPIAYPSLTRVNNAASTSVSTYIPLTKAYGNRILAIISANFNNLGTNRSFNNAHGRFDLASYNQFLNNVAVVSQAGFNTSVRGEDYILANKEYLKGSVIQSVGDYSFAEWVDIVSFFGSKPLHTVDQHEIDGLDVGMQTSTFSQQYNFATGLALSYVSAIIGQKTLTINNQGAMVM